MISVNKRRRTAYIISLIIVSIFAIAMELSFRAYLYRRLGSGSAIAGSIPNFVAVLFLGLVYKIRNRDIAASATKISLMGAGTMICYELIQPLIQGRTFDWLDVFASVLGGLSLFILLFAIHRCITE